MDENEELIKAMRQLNETMNGLGVSATSGRGQLVDTLNQFGPLGGKAEKLVKGLGELGGAAAKLTTSLYSGKQGAEVLADAAEKAADGFSSLLSMFGPLGKVAGFAVQAIAKAGKVIAQQSDQLFKSYQNLSRSGAAAAGGIEQMFKTMQNFGYGIEQLGDMENLIKENAQSLAAFRGNVYTGAKAMGDVAKGIVRSNIGGEFMRMGLSVDDINKNIGGYIQLQSRLGNVQTRTTEDITKSVASYIRETDAITKLTGINREQQEAAQQRALTIEQFRYRQEKLIAEGRSDQAAVEMRVYKAMENQPKLQQAYAESLNGAIASQNSANLYVISGGKSLQLAGRSFEEQMEILHGAAESGIKTYGDNLIKYGQFGDAMGLSAAELYDFKNTMGDMSKRSKEVTDEQNKQGKSAGKIVDAQVALRQSQMNARDSLQSFVQIGVNPATRALQKLAGIPEAAAGTLPGETPAAGVGGRGGAAPTAKGQAGRTGLSGGGALAGAAYGAAVGSIVPGLGTVMGGAVGGLIGAVGGGMMGGGGTAAGGDKTTQLLDYIGKLESGNNYNTLVGGRTADLTNMTVGQVMEMQRGMIGQGFQSTAVGKYQIIQKTLAELVQQGVVSPDDKFNSSTQDKLAIALMKRRGLEKYQSGTLSADQFANNLAMEWASLPTSSGKSYYQGVGSNRALAGRDSLMGILSAANGGVLSGPRSGYSATLHGTEAVVPLPDGRTIPVAMPELTEGFGQQQALMGAQIAKLDDLITLMSRQVGVSEKILQHSTS